MKNNIYICGSVESSDVLVKYELTNDKLEINVESKVIHQFGAEIKALVAEICKEQQIENGIISVNDQGAIPTVIKARILGVISRMKGDK